MHGRLGLAQPAEDPLGQLVLPGGEAARVDHRLDVVQVAMGVLVRGDRPWRASRGSRPGGPSRRSARTGRPRLGDGRLDRPGIDPGVDQGAERHVAGDPAEAVEIADAHAASPARMDPGPAANAPHSSRPPPPQGRDHAGPVTPADSRREPRPDLVTALHLPHQCLVEAIGADWPSARSPRNRIIPETSEDRPVRTARVAGPSQSRPSGQPVADRRGAWGGRDVTCLKTQVNPVTGEKQHIAMSRRQEKALGLQAAPEMAEQMGGAHRPRDRPPGRAGRGGRPPARRAERRQPEPLRRQLPLLPAGRPQDDQRLRPARRADLHHRGPVRQARRRGPARRRARPRDRPRHQPPLRRADGQGPARPDADRGRRRRRQRRRDDGGRRRRWPPRWSTR